MLFTDLPVRKKLKRTAVPTIHIDRTPTREETHKSKRTVKRGRKQVVSQIITDPNVSDVQILDEIDEPRLIQPFASSRENIMTNVYEDKYRELLLEHNQLKLRFNKLKRTSANKLKVLNAQLRYYKRKTEISHIQKMKWQ